MGVTVAFLSLEICHNCHNLSDMVAELLNCSFDTLGCVPWTFVCPAGLSSP